jgi:hypothetical protein
MAAVLLQELTDQENKEICRRGLAGPLTRETGERARQAINNNRWYEPAGRQ